MELLEAYVVLEVPEGATEAQIRASYRDLINVWHPDRFQHNERLRKKAEEQTKLLNKAYAIVSSAGFPRAHTAGRPSTAGGDIAPPPPPDVNNQPSSRRASIIEKYSGLLISFLLVIACLAVYWQTFHYDFVNYDDPVYVTKNAHVQAGLTSESVKWAFTDVTSSNWHPLTWLSHMLDWELYQKNAGGHHVTNVLLHILSSILLFLALNRLTGFEWRSGFVAGLFALHPLHVESVAWIAERKDVLSALFWMLTLLLYAQYAKRPRASTYLAVLLSFALGLLSKPMMVSLPLVLLILDYWPLGRMHKERNRCVVEKLPFGALAAVSCYVTIIAQHAGNAVPPSSLVPFVVRLQNALLSYIAYIVKAVWPVNMAVFYPHRGSAVSPALASLAGIALVGVTILAIVAARKRPYLLAGWLWFVVTLVPVIGLVQVGAQAMADRYTYLTFIGLFVIVAWGVPDIFSPQKQPALKPEPVTQQRRKKKKTIRQEAPIISAPAPMNLPLATAGIVVLLCLGGAAYSQASHWKNSITLFTHVAKVTQNNALAYLNLANAQLEKGNNRAAVENYRKSIAIKPDVPKTYNNYGNALIALGKPAEAVPQYREALQIDPNFAPARANLGIALVQLNRFDEAIEEFKQALKLNPDIAMARTNLGVAYTRKSLWDPAIEEFRRAIELDPNQIDAHANLAGAHYMKGDYRKAWEEVAACRALGAKMAPDFIRRLSQMMPEPKR